MDKLKRLRSKIVHAKLFSQRGISYIAIVNSAMILFLLLSNLEKYGIDIDITQWFVPILIVGMLGLTLIGYVEDKLGFFSTETEVAQRRNPQLNELLDRVKRIERKVGKLKMISKKIFIRKRIHKTLDMIHPYLAHSYWRTPTAHIGEL